VEILVMTTSCAFPKDALDANSLRV